MWVLDGRRLRPGLLVLDRRHDAAWACLLPIGRVRDLIRGLSLGAGELHSTNVELTWGPDAGSCPPGAQPAPQRHHHLLPRRHPPLWRGGRPQGHRRLSIDHLCRRRWRLLRPFEAHFASLSRPRTCASPTPVGSVRAHLQGARPDVPPSSKPHGHGRLVLIVDARASCHTVRAQSAGSRRASWAHALIMASSGWMTVNSVIRQPATAKLTPSRSRHPNAQLRHGLEGFRRPTCDLALFTSPQLRGG